MRRNQWIAVAVVLVLLALGAVWRLRGRGGGDDGSTATGSAAHGSAAGGAARANGPRAPASPASLAGRVTRRSDGAGVAGAIVSLGRAELDTMFGAKDEPTITITTDAQGGWSAAKVPPGRYTIAATARGYVPASLDKLVLAEGEHRTGLDLVVDAGGTRVSGTVSDVGGGSVAGARITFGKERSTPFGMPELIAMSGPDGTYEINLGDGGYTAQVSHEDYTHAERSLEVAGTPLTIDFVLAPGSSIHGVVVTRDGKPVPDALVMASGGHGRGGGGGMARADASGAFTMHSLGSGSISLTASARGAASDQPTVVALGIGEQIEGVRVVVDRAFSISGNVVEKGTKKGVPGVRLGAFSIGSTALALAPDPSAEDGAFEIVGVKPASYMLFAVGETTMPEIGKPVEVIDKDVTGVTIEMGIGVTVSGRVEPGTVAEVTIEPTQVGIGNIFEAIKALLVRADSDVTGAFVLHHVPPGAFTLHAHVTDGRAGSLPLVVALVDQTGIVIKLEPRASITGRVVDGNGAPVAGVKVEITAKADKGSADFRMSPGGREGPRTGADGTFRAVGLDDGVHELGVHDDQGAIPWAKPADKAKPKAPIEVTLAKAEQKTGVTLTVEARDGVIKGVVVDADRKPVADAWVTARVDGNRSDMFAIEIGEEIAAMGGKPPTLTGADGTFTFEHLRRADYTIVAETAKGTARVEQKGIKTGTTVTLQLAPLGTLTGHVTVAGAPVTAFDLICDGTGPDVRRRVTDPDGAYSVERLAPGHFKCTAMSDAGRGSAEVDVPAGPATLDFALAPWATITGTVVSVLTGEPLAGLKLLVEDGAFSERSIGDTLTGHGPTSDATGRFLIPQVAAGKGTVGVMPKDAGFVELAKRDYEVTAGQRLDLGTIKVVPPRTGDAGTLGLSTDLVGDALAVTAIKPGGPAETGGVQVGDKIVSINGIPVATLTPKLAQTLVSSGTVTIGQPYQLALDRAGARVEVVLVGVRW